MKKRFFCLLLALLMLAACFLTGCSQKAPEDAQENAANKASESAETLTMFMITERHVYTQDEVDNIKAQYGETSAEYIEAKGVMDSYAEVAKALDKITKAKFRTQLVTTFYTEEEYTKVEEIIGQQIKLSEMKEEAKSLLRKFTREQKAMGITDEALIKSMFYEKYPEYAELTEAETLAPDVTTEAETIVDDYGIEQLKYPAVKPNQVDIICVCGYDNYVNFIDSKWLTSVDGELDGDSKAILTYVNEKFLKAATVYDAIYGIPNNTMIGEYTYLLINKEKYDFYEYDYEGIPKGSSAIYSSDFMGFIEDIKRYDPEYVPITGNLTLTNELFWSLSYEYISAGTLPDAAAIDEDILYFSKESPDSDTYRLLTVKPDSQLTYATVTETEFKGTAFEANTDYYTKGADGYYTLAEEYESGVTYYTLKFSDVSNEKFESFEEDTVYFQKTYAQGTAHYLPIYTHDPETEYYYVFDASFEYDTFNVIGTMLSTDASIDTKLSPLLFKDDSYRNQIIAINKLLSKETVNDTEQYVYYDPDAISDENKKFATAVIKGDASLVQKYGDDYHMIVLEAPKADANDLCQNLFAVTSSCKQVTRAMDVITYINTNIEFRNILQYGILGKNYVLEDKIDSVTGETYKAVKRLNNYYSMDINKTGNVFIAYPEENMDHNIWDYGKLQNSDAVYNPLLEFNLSEYISKIDFTMVDYFKKLSAQYEADINACKTEAELNETFDRIEAELASNVYYRREAACHGAPENEDGSSSNLPAEYNQYSLFNHYMNWWVTTEYFVPLEID